MLLLRAFVAPRHADRDRGAVVRGRPRGERAVLQQRVQLRRGRHLVPAVRVRLPRRARHRLQHLPDDPGPGGGARHGARRGAVTGLAATGGVITSAGAVLAGTFAALATLPVTFLTELGFAVAFGVLLDTIVVRSVLVTALNLDLGRWVWWPSRLAREPAPEAEDLGRAQPGGLGRRAGDDGTQSAAPVRTYSEDQSERVRVSLRRGPVPPRRARWTAGRAATASPGWARRAKGWAAARPA